MLQNPSVCVHDKRIQVGPIEGKSHHVCRGCGQKIAERNGKNPLETFERCDECDINMCENCTKPRISSAVSSTSSFCNDFQIHQKSNENYYKRE